MSAKVDHLIPLIRMSMVRNHREFELAKEAMAESLRKSVIDDYRTKSLGQTGEDGQTWEATQKFLRDGKRMLIVTETLINGFEIEVTDYGFRVYNDVEYAKHQLNKRLPWPNDQLPPVWIKRMLQAAKPHLAKMVVEGLREAMQITHTNASISRVQ